MASILLLLEAYITCGHDDLVAKNESCDEKKEEEMGGIMKAKKQGKACSSTDNLDCFWIWNEETKAWKLAECGIWP